MTPDSGSESESDSGSEDGLVWKKRKAGYPLAECQGESSFAIGE